MRLHQFWEFIHSVSTPKRAFILPQDGGYVECKPFNSKELWNRPFLRVDKRMEEKSILEKTYLIIILGVFAAIHYPLLARSTQPVGMKGLT